MQIKNSLLAENLTHMIFRQPFVIQPVLWSQSPSNCG